MPKFRFTGGFLTGGLFPKSASNGDSGSAPDTSSLPDTDTLAGGPPRDRDPRPMLPRFHDARMPPTSLHEAAYLGDADSVQTFLEDGYGVDSLASPGDVTPLHLATMQGHKAAMRTLLLAGAFPGSLSEEGYSPLHLATLIKAPKMRVESMLTLLAFGSDPSSSTSQGETALHLAVETRQVEPVQILLQGGAKVDAVDDFGWTPLHVAAETGHVPTIKALLRAGAKVKAVTREGYTPLHLAAKGGHDEAVTLLLRNGASHTAQDVHGARPLHFAARSQHARTLTVLCAAGAKASSEAADGATPLHISASLGDTPGINAMLEAHPLPAKKLCKPLRASGLSPLHLAAAENRVAAVKHLLDAGVPHNSQCALKRTAMHYAAERLHIATIRELLAAGASATVTDKFGDTPLHCCCRGWEPGKKDQCSAAATALLEAGASPTASNKRGETPLTMAGGQSVPQLERLLERAHSAQMRKLGKIPTSPRPPATPDPALEKSPRRKHTWNLFAAIPK